ncbi:ubiquitin-like-specific protease 1D isoform X2 [Ipomoea triloba]|uniref:ubiquitin-like-specific protease 1D isoform X2 n=1 Tax=Ipomoea triloba TaxID=35885 RepID=UPI00125E3A4A|nr:ubiquitin-like-specific protease 1D isoform X2 [Ipomoea triloba]
MGGGSEEKQKGGIPLNIDELLRDREDEPPPELVVVSTAAVKPPSTVMDDDERRDDLQELSDETLRVKIERTNRLLSCKNLPDGGEKLRHFIKRLRNELERRQRDHLRKEVDKQEGHDHIGAGLSNGFMQPAPSSSTPNSQSSFAACFSKRLEPGNHKVGNAFESEMSTLNPCDSKRVPKRQIPPRRRQERGLSSRSASFKARQRLSNTGLKRSISSTTSHSEEDFYSSVTKKNNSSEVQGSNRPRCKNGETVVLVDEEEQEAKQMDQLDFMDESTKDLKLYYPSRDDPDPIELCYSDMECLAPEAYLSSTIMNFYIRYLQQTKSSPDRGGCNYHFFNTYFYNKLKEAMLNKNDKESSFVKLRRWWKGVNLFEKAYLFLPIHESLHWSLVIICIPDKEDESGPIVLHLDSLMFHCSKPIFNNTRKFLIEEWKILKDEGPHFPIADKIWEKLPRRIEEKEIEVPQQKNDYDCGPFVLFFIERFIDEVSERLKRKDLDMFGKKWFKPHEASNLRQKLKSILAKEFKRASKALKNGTDDLT